MEEVMVPALSSSSVFNSKQWQMQQHDILLIQQRKQLEQLKKEQEELKTRLRRYGKVSTQIAQVSPKHVTVTQAAPHQPVATLTTADNSEDNSSVKQSNINDLMDNSKPDTIPELVRKSDDADSTTVPRSNVISDSSSSGSDDVAEHATLQATCNDKGRLLNYDDRPIKPLQGRLV